MIVITPDNNSDYWGGGGMKSILAVERGAHTQQIINELS